MSSLDSILKSRDITLPTKVHLVKVTVFPVVMYGCESWTIKKAEHQGIDAFELWCWRRLLRVPWTARRSNQSILKEISPGYSLEGLMLKLKLQYFASWCEELTHLKRPWCWETLKAGGEGDDRGWDGWMPSPTRWTWVWVNSGSWWWTGRPGVLQSMGLQRVRHNWVTELNWIVKSDQECSPWKQKQVYKIVHTWWVTNGNYFLSPISALQICLWAPLSCFYNNILSRCLGLPLPFGYQYNIIFSYSRFAPISKGHFHISKLTTPFLYVLTVTCLDVQWVTISVSKLLPVYEPSPVGPGRQQITSLLCLPVASSKTPHHFTLLMLQDQERVEEREERLPSPGNDAPDIGKWASCPDKHCTSILLNLGIPFPTPPPSPALHSFLTQQ